MDFRTFKPFSGNHFSEKQIKSTRDQLGAPGVVHPRSLTSGPACQPGPLARTQRGESSGEPELAVGDFFRRNKLPNTLYGSRRTKRTPLRGLKWTGAGSPPAMAGRRRCSPRSGHHTAVERALTAGIGARGQGEANASKSVRNGGVEGENHGDREVAGVSTYSGELFRAHGTHRAR